MKKLITMLAIILMASPAFAIDSVEETKAKVKVGPVKANVKNSSDNGNASITRAGDTVIIGCTYSKVVIKGIKSSATAIAMALSFDSVEGDFEAGQTYDLSNSNPTALTSVIAAARSKGANVRGVSTLNELMGEEIPVTSGKMKVKKYDAETGEITADISLKVSPTVLTKGTKNKLSSKAQKIQIKINTIVQ